jgi:hypothetical protein
MAPMTPVMAPPAPEEPMVDRGAEKEEAIEAPARPRAVGREFDAEMDAAELDERDRPGPTWTARGRTLSRSTVVIRSRRMSFTGRRVLMAVHLIDSQPVPLFGIVQACEYDGEGLYQITIDFMPVPDKAEVRDWLHERAK